MRWNDLKALVISKFCPKNEVHKVEREFLTLQAGLMTHRQYTSKYNELARLVPHLVTTEERRIHYYIQGLPPKIRTFVNANTLSTFESVVVLSGVVYDDIASEVISEAPMKQAAKRTGEDLQGPNDKRSRLEAEGLCGKYGKSYGGECRAGQVGCFRCGRFGHQSRDCPESPRCHNCGEQGHRSQDCRKPKKAEAGGSGKGKAAEKEPYINKATSMVYQMTQSCALAKCAQSRSCALAKCAGRGACALAKCAGRGTCALAKCAGREVCALAKCAGSSVCALAKYAGIRLMLLVQDVRYGFYPLVRTLGFVNSCTIGMSDSDCSGGPRNLPLVLSGIVGSWTLAMGALTRYSSVRRRLPWGRYSSDKELTDKWYCRFMDVSHGGIDQVLVGSWSLTMGAVQ
ncbi:hypothetical protein L1987_18662 [Smallanthus sonchifolius]|uniref:Uncharacterized protein n=1 Tax=Smallanthus sonchifolius TaxID=185202 RepID=A0ACB9J3U6_9ASTR|nr:hypothetical protein L1987_18662 [Smallanthus sonchifolius]